MFSRIYNLIRPTQAAQPEVSAPQSAALVAAASNVAMLLPIGPVSRIKKDASSRSPAAKHRWSGPTDVATVDVAGSTCDAAIPPSFLNISKKSEQFVEKTIAGHIENFISLTKNYEEIEDPALIVNAAKKIDTGVSLLARVAQLPGDAALLDTLKKISQAANAFAEKLPTQNKVTLLQKNGTTHVDSEKEIPWLLPAEGTGAWYKKNIEALQSLYKILDSAEVFYQLTPKAASKLQMLTDIGLTRMRSNLAKHLEGATKMITVQRETIGQFSEGWHASCRGRASVAHLKQALLEYKTIQSRTTQFSQDVKDVVDIIKLTKSIFGKRLVLPTTYKKMSYLAANKVETAMLNQADVMFDGMYAQLVFIAKTGNALEEPIKSQIAGLVDKVAHLIANVKYKFDEEEEYQYVSAAENRPVLCALIDRLGDQFYTLEVDFRRMASHVEARDSVKFAEHIDLKNLLGNIAERCGELRVVNSNVMLSFQSESQLITPMQRERLKHLKKKYFKAVDKELVQPNVASLARAPTTSATQTVGVSKFKLLGTSDNQNLNLAEQLTASSQVKTRSRRKEKHKAKAVANQPGVSNDSAPMLQRAQLVVVDAMSESADNVKNLYDNSLAYAEHQLTTARDAVANPGKFPQSVTKVEKYVYCACDCLERCAENIEQRLEVLRHAMQDIKNLAPESDAKASQQQEIFALEKQWQERAKGLRVRSDELLPEAALLGGAQTLNCFLNYPTYSHYQRLVADKQVQILTEKTFEKKRLSPVTVFGVEKPTPDYLDVYTLKIVGSHAVEGAEQSDHAHAWVELHLHYDSNDANAQPTCGHLKNQEQASLGGPDVYRGRVSNVELIALTQDICNRAERKNETA